MCNADQKFTLLNGNAGQSLKHNYYQRDANSQTIDSFKDEDFFEYVTFKNKILHRLKKYIEYNGELKIGYVLPMTSIRATLKAVFNKSHNGLKSKMVVGLTD